ncbi:hypothetical protein [Clostridium sp.]|uniref:hypothetical protein n=1 Tax=Clostridium sp. TaxID=1506 RepID=UPI002FCB3957
MDLKCFSTNQIIALSVLIAIIVARKLNAKEQVVVAGMLYIIADVISLINQQMQSEESNEEDNCDSNANQDSFKEINNLQEQINELKCYISHLESRI